MVGLSRATWHYRQHPRAAVAQPIPQAQRAYRTRISLEDRAQIAALIHAAWSAGHSVDHAFAESWNTGLMLASRRSWWRIGATLEDQSARPTAPTRRSRRAHTAATGSAKPAAPVLIATCPQQVWSWDITDLRTPWRGRAFKAYCVLDIYSRKIMAWRVEEREVDLLAVEMFEKAFTDHGAPRAVHSDSGAAMRSGALADLLAEREVAKTHNRPRVSNDNPFSESEFKTMKYRPSYPTTFDTLEEARAWVATYVTWYNSHHHHSGIALFTPDEVHHGAWQQAWQVRDGAYQAYYEAHPERFRRRPVTPAPATVVAINQPSTAPEAC